MSLSVEDLTAFAQGRLEDDFAACDRRGKRGSKDDFAEGWIAFAVRHRFWVYFTDEARARLKKD